MRTNMTRLALAIVTVLAPLSLIASPAHAEGGCYLLDDLDAAEGTTLYEDAPEGSGYYTYICQDGMWIFTGYAAE
ncbi:hypothetical protein [Nonomuraea sediminis]|uniref:hypothetical protein n=1 Tax=Nonomuraea sediminis TaxID=2835864 RepID=UPI001BDC9A96|nr:hypothetical protein [Nonomuraea sediminis]